MSNLDPFRVLIAAAVVFFLGAFTLGMIACWRHGPWTDAAALNALAFTATAGAAYVLEIRPK